MKIIVNVSTGRVHAPGCGHLDKARGERQEQIGKRAARTVEAADQIGMLCQVCEKALLGGVA